MGPIGTTWEITGPARASTEAGVRSPLQEAGLTKAEIRAHSEALGLPTWDKPSAPCLASRLPYGSEVTDEKLRQIEAAEAALRALGFRECRVRHHGSVARIEVPLTDFARLLDETVRAEAAVRIQAAGFLYVALDILGLRSGSLNEAIGKAPAGPLPALPPDSIRIL